MQTTNRRRTPVGNRIALAVLRSTAHRLLSGSVLVLRVRGRRTGAVHVLPVQYAREDDRIVVLPRHPERKQWWRNLTDAAPVSILVAGAELGATGRVLRPGHPGFRTAAAVYGRRHPRLARAAHDAAVLVELTVRP